MQIRRILVPIDFSEQSRAAVAAAVDLARSTKAELTLFHVHPIEVVSIMEFTYVEPAASIASVVRAAEEGLGRIAREIAPPVPATQVAVVTGNPAQEIIARSTEHDLVVMSTHGRSGLGHFLLGSVAERVVRGARCSVLVVKPGKEP